MNNLSPKINAIYYKNIIENILFDYIAENNDKITVSNNLYIVSDNKSKTRLKKYFTTKILDEIRKYVTPFSNLNPNYFFIIGSCYPKDNELLKFKDKFIISKKLLNIIYNKPDIKYLIKEKDIVLDIELINVILDEIFNDLFNHKKFLKLYGKECENIFFIKNSNLDCLLTYRIMRNEFGRKNVINLYEKNSNNMKSFLYSINEFLDRSIKGKREYIKSDQMKNTVNYIVQYVNECLNNGKK